MTTTTEIPERWVTSNAMFRKLHGPAETINKAWEAAGRPVDFQTFRKIYEAAAAELGKGTAGPEELVQELEINGRLLYFAYRQMTLQQRTLYARNAHAAGIGVGEDYMRSNERAAVLAKFGGARA